MRHYVLIAKDQSFVDITFRSFGGIEFGPDGWTVRVAHPDSAWVRDFDEIAARELPRLRGTFAPLSADERYDIDIHRCAYATFDWSDVTLYGGPFPFSRDNALRLYRRLPFVFRAVHRTLLGEVALCA